MAVRFFRATSCDGAKEEIEARVRKRRENQDRARVRNPDDGRWRQTADRGPGSGGAWRPVRITPTNSFRGRNPIETENRLQRIHAARRSSGGRGTVIRSVRNLALRFAPAAPRVQRRNPWVRGFPDRWSRQKNVALLISGPKLRRFCLADPSWRRRLSETLRSFESALTRKAAEPRIPLVFSGKKTSLKLKKRMNIPLFL